MDGNLFGGMFVFGLVELILFLLRGFESFILFDGLFSSDGTFLLFQLLFLLKYKSVWKLFKLLFNFLFLLLEFRKFALYLLTILRLFILNLVFFSL